jgi:cell division protein FtsL
VNMATAYRWSEEHAQGLRPNLTGAGSSSVLKRQQIYRVNDPRWAGAQRVDTVRNDESGATAEKRKVVPTRLFRMPRLAKSKKPALVEFYTVKRIDNSRLVRHVEPVKVRNLYKTVALGGVLAAFCMMYIYQHFRCIDLSFQLEDLKSKQVQAQSLNSELKLEIETLRDPHRIDVIAQKELGLKRPESTQVRESGNPDGSEVASVQDARVNRVP